ncbi:hypothetical protein GBA52_008455 [Prunus armeniaca]|nr:hypothetical protein GBA52_008455 [Prunus armeniaca]
MVVNFMLRISSQMYPSQEVGDTNNEQGMACNDDDLSGFDLARDILAIPAITVASEATFSVGGRDLISVL